MLHVIMALWKVLFQDLLLDAVRCFLVYERQGMRELEFDASLSR
jgi:hypothetical protein